VGPLLNKSPAVCTVEPQSIVFQGLGETKQ